MNLNAPDVVLVFSGEMTSQLQELIAKDINRTYGPTVMPIFSSEFGHVAVYGCEKIEAPSLAGLVGEIVTKHMTDIEAQDLYEFLWSRGHRIK